MRRHLLFDRAISRMCTARRVVAIGGREEGDAGVADGVDPEAGADAISIAGMAPHRPGAAEQIVTATRLGDWQALHGEAVGAIETLLIGPVAAVIGPERGGEHGDARSRQEATAIVPAAC